MLKGSKKVAALVLVGALVGGSAQAGVSDLDKRAAKKAARFLADQQKRSGKFASFSDIGSTSDAIVAFVAARRGPRAIRKAYDFLERNQGDVQGVGLKAKVILALVATGRSPRDFAGRNLVREILAVEQPNGQYGEGTAVFDQALAVLALVGAGKTPSRPAIQWLADAQCGDGGWEYLAPPAEGDDESCFSGDPSTDFFASDTNTTGYVIQALEAAKSDVSLGANPIRFLRAARDEQKNGWGYSPGMLTDSNSTALVIQAFQAADKELPLGAKKALRALQWNVCEVKGGFAYTWQDEDGDGKLEKTPADVGATIGALPAVVEKAFPITGSLPRKNQRPLDCQA